MKKTSETHDNGQIAPVAENQESKLEQQLAILFERMDREIVLPRKYYPALQFSINRRLIDVHSATPNQYLKAVVVEIVDSLDRRIPADKLLEIIGFVVKTWTGLCQESQPLKSAKRKASLPTPA